MITQYPDYEANMYFAVDYEPYVVLGDFVETLTTVNETTRAEYKLATVVAIFVNKQEFERHTMNIPINNKYKPVFSAMLQSVHHLASCIK